MSECCRTPRNGACQVSAKSSLDFGMSREFMAEDPGQDASEEAVQEGQL